MFRALILGFAALALGPALGACGGSAAPSPAEAPAAPRTAAPPAAPAPEAAPAKAAWQVDWEKTLQAAKKEGRVLVTTFSYSDRVAVEQFPKTFPDVKMEAQILPGNQFVARAPVEMKAGIYNYDVYMSGSTTAVNQLLPQGFVFLATRDFLVLPEVVGDQNWVGVFDDWWADDDTKKYVSSPGASDQTPSFRANREKAPKEKLSTLDDWFRPEFKGKACLMDPRLIGNDGLYNLVRIFRGEAFLRRLLTEPSPRIFRDQRQLATDLVRGDCVIGVGGDFLEADRLGLTKHLEDVQERYSAIPPEVRGQVKIICCGAGKSKNGVDGIMAAGVGGPVLLQGAPHPNAARVFVNWFLTKEGQDTRLGTPERTPEGYYSSCTGRRDVLDKCEPVDRPVDGNAYISFNYKSNFRLRDETIKFNQQVLGR